MTIVAGMREHDVWLEFACKIFERILYLSKLGGEVAVTKCMYANGF